MVHNWTTQLSGWRAEIKVDLPANAMVYTCNMMMAQASPLPPLTGSQQFWGDISSSNVIVVGTPDHFILAGAVTTTGKAARGFSPS